MTWSGQAYALIEFQRSGVCEKQDIVELQWFEH